MQANVVEQIFLFIYILVKAVRGLGGAACMGRGWRGQKGSFFCSSTAERWIFFFLKICKYRWAPSFHWQSLVLRNQAAFERIIRVAS